MYSLQILPSVYKIFRKLEKKNPKQMDIIDQKIEEILQNPERYKNLRSPLQHLKRAQIDKSFVRVFSVDRINKKVILKGYEHHDDVYE